MGFQLSTPSTITLLLLALSAPFTVATGPLGTTQPPPPFSDATTCAIYIPEQGVTKYLPSGLSSTYINDTLKNCYAYKCESVPEPGAPIATRLNGQECGSQSQCVKSSSVFNNVCVCTQCPTGANAQADPCKVIPDACKNNGKCTGDSQTGSYTCDCPARFSSFDCSYDKCSSNPCLNGGTCVTDESMTVGYRCDCKPAYTDTYCQTDKCSVPPCYYGACELTSDAPGFKCTCIAGYTGTLCKLPAN